MKREIYEGQDVIDSRDIITRIEELEALLPETAAEVIPGTSDEIEEIRKELASLNALQDEASASPDWQYGETLIADSYFEEYAEQLANDIGAIDRNANWPTCHIDWEAAANSLKQDYMLVSFGNTDYWIRA